MNAHRLDRLDKLHAALRILLDHVEDQANSHFTDCCADALPFPYDHIKLLLETSEEYS